MKFFWAVLLVIGAVCWASAIFAAEAVAESAAAAGPGVGAMIWAFLNTPAGLSIIGFVMVFVLGKLFTAKPKWKAYMDKYKPLLITAVKKAEKAIADDNPNKNLERLDEALKFMIAIDSRLDQAALKDAITAVHAEVEKKDKSV